MYRIRNWTKYQHYATRNPPWIKLHYELLYSPDWINANESTRSLMIVCMLIASRNGGNLAPNELNSAQLGLYLKRVGSFRKMPDINPLIECGFIEKVLATCKHDASTMLAPETETDRQDRVRVKRQTREDVSFEGWKVSPLSESDLEKARKEFPGYDIEQAEREWVAWATARNMTRPRKPGVAFLGWLDKRDWKKGNGHDH